MYIHDSVGDFDKFYDLQLPNRSAFYNNCVVNTSQIDDDDEFKHTEKKYGKCLRMKNMDDHHDLYLKRNILLLAGVTENFTENCLKY